MFQPPPQGNEDEEHGGRVKEGHGAPLGLLGHGHHQDDEGVDVGDARGQHDEHVHVGHAVSQRFVGLDVEVPAAEELEGGGGERQSRRVLLGLQIPWAHPRCGHPFALRN